MRAGMSIVVCSWSSGTRSVVSVVAAVVDSLCSIVWVVVLGAYLGGINLNYAGTEGVLLLV